METYTIITGASTGFGRSLAIECAKKNMNLVLASLANSGLPKLSKFLKENFSIDVIYFELDLSLKENCIKIHNDLKTRNISVKYLINNAGVLSKGLFEDLNEDYVVTQIKVNVTTPTILTKLFMNDFKANAPSGILNVSSMASFFHLPKKQVYGGTKAYLLSFSKSLRKEVEKYGINVSLVCPGGMNTTTKLCLQNRRLGWISRASIMNPETVAKSTLRDFFKGKSMIIPGRVNKAFMLLNSLLPEFIKSRLTKNAI